MKKLMIAVAAMTAGIALADVSSANTVGYTSQLAAQGFRLISAQFESIDGTANINDLFKYTSAANFTDSDYKTKAPQIQLLNSEGGYDIYYLVADAYYEDGPNNWKKGLGWIDEYNTGTKVKPDYVTKKYCKRDGEIIPGTGVWFKDPTAPDTLTTAGQVVTADVTIDVPAGFRIRANPFPTAICINDSTVMKFLAPGSSDPLVATSTFASGTYKQDAQQLQLSNGEGGYDIYYYVHDAYYEDGPNNWKQGDGWIDEYNTGTKATPEYLGKKYCKRDGVILTMTGFWARSTSADKAFDMKFIAPMK